MKDLYFSKSSFKIYLLRFIGSFHEALTEARPFTKARPLTEARSLSRPEARSLSRPEARTEALPKVGDHTKCVGEMCVPALILMMWTLFFWLAGTLAIRRDD